jgi:hypothetical protein
MATPNETAPLLGSKSHSYCLKFVNQTKKCLTASLTYTIKAIAYSEPAALFIYQSFDVLVFSTINALMLSNNDNVQKCFVQDIEEVVQLANKFLYLAAALVGASTIVSIIQKYRGIPYIEQQHSNRFRAAIQGAAIPIAFISFLNINMGCSILQPLLIVSCILTGIINAAFGNDKEQPMRASAQRNFTDINDLNRYQQIKWQIKLSGTFIKMITLIIWSVFANIQKVPGQFNPITRIGTGIPAIIQLTINLLTMKYATTVKQFCYQLKSIYLILATTIGYLGLPTMAIIIANSNNLKQGEIPTNVFGGILGFLLGIMMWHRTNYQPSKKPNQYLARLFPKCCLDHINNETSEEPNSPDQIMV